VKVKIRCLREPELAFGNGKTGLAPRLMLPEGGPADIGRHPRICLGLVGRAEDIDASRRWLARLNHFMPALEGNSYRYRDWPGGLKALGTHFAVEDAFVRPIDSHRYELAMAKASGRDRFEELLELFDSRIQGLFGDVRPDCILVCVPDELGDLRVENPGLTVPERAALERLRAEEEEHQLALFQPSPEELKAAEDLRMQADDLLFRTYYRALKARAMTHVNPVPLQILRRDTVERPDNLGHSSATRAWNLAVSLYYKAGGLPWRPAELPANVCFVGVSFHHLKRRGDDLVYASVAQAFSTEVEPFALKGATLDRNQRRERQPYLTSGQASALMTEVLDAYEARAGVAPDRVVVHKTSHYQPEEQEGFPSATRHRVPACNLVWLRSTAFRLIRRGFEEPWRGTLCTVGEDMYLFTSGFVPWWKEYPGPHIPAPIELGSGSDTDLSERAREILSLSKMNWNSTEGLSRYPITLSFAKRVGQLMSELPDNHVPNPSYRFYM
jgi:hypothetical protein